MKLWLLKRNKYSYDETESHVICAKTEDKARKLAKKRSLQNGRFSGR